MRRIHHVAQDDPLAAPLLTELSIEYSTRYGRTAAEIRDELATYPAAEFAPPSGGLLVVTEHGEPVAGGAFRRYDANTAELKRIWTARGHRRRGLGRLVLAELETEITRRGYQRIYLTTGPRQPEAVALYNAAGYTALERVIEHEVGRLHPFEKQLNTGAAPRSGGTKAYT
ncbi:GNAT family N-acetyltransferase [Nocardia sp. CA-290969]|uniref:GNAT family N-acetyltransferase n=1 Tax=Nocardia sp. CA-290969 TaxID=3239986 RepID=UPI003D9274D0